jgi:hypothetical protein
MSAPQREVVWEVVDGEAVIVDVTTGDYFSLNSIATDVWTSLQGGANVPSIVDATATRYGVERATVERDIAELVGELEDIGLWNP